MYKLIITPKAISDIQKAVDYYNEKKQGLGKQFFESLQHQFNAIEQNPQYRSIRYGNIRMAHLIRFPYAAHYEIKDKAVIVNAVLCDYQNKN